MEKMAEWHVELEDNKPEEIPGKSSCDYKFNEGIYYGTVDIIFLGEKYVQ